MSTEQGPLADSAPAAGAPAVDSSPAADAAADATLAEAVNQAKLAALGMLVAGVAHEVNTPLGALHSNHDLLKRAIGKLQVILEDEVVEPHELDELRRVVRALDGILRVNDLAVERMMSLVKSLRTFGRLDRSQFDRADLHEGLDATFAILAHETREIDVVLDYGELPLLHCQPDRLNQVWMNLAVNAVHAMKEGGTLTVRTRASDAKVSVEFDDTGVGMTPETIQRIFEPGFTTKSGRIGMGLGLLISRQIVEQHGGRITVRSEPGTGSTFTIVLPRGGA